MKDAPPAKNIAPPSDGLIHAEPEGGESRGGRRRPKVGRWRAPADWRDRLGVRTPEGILERIVDGDPLGLRRLVGEVIRREGRLADADRVHLRALALIAHRATAEELPKASRWVEDRVQEALSDVLASEQAKLEAAETPGPTEAFAVLAGPLGLEAMDLRRVCSAVNARPAEERAAFFALLVDGRGLEVAAREAGVKAVELARRARRALDAVLDAVEPEAVEPKDAKGPSGESAAEVTP